MSILSHVSLIDLTKQFPFEIDKEVKKQICFSETLVISCGHYEGEKEGSSSSASDWTCQESEVASKTEVSDKVSLTDLIELPEELPASDDNLEEEDKDFHFYFFPDCNEPSPPQHSKTSIVVVDGVPQINPKVKNLDFCTCDQDRKGDCECFVKLPCSCGAKTKPECDCSKLENICICNPKKPKVVCKCKGKKICLCFPGQIHAICTCKKVDIPCVCHPDKFPSPVCECKHKPKFDLQEKKILEEKEESVHSGEDGEENNKEEEEEEEVTEIQEEEELEAEFEPCDCQKKDLPPQCLCVKNKECICKKTPCICDVRPPCVCESTESHKPICDKEESKTLCSCEKGCVCDKEEGQICKCFPKPAICTCGNPDDCKCFSVCDCTNPCICDTSKKVDECNCLENLDLNVSDMPCACRFKGPDEGRNLKRKRAGKHGYRWCPDIDPRHTCFDYAYDRHDKISYKEQLREKYKVLGLFDEKKTEEETVDGTVKAPKYEKKARRPSIDCCTAVGGITISVETLGEEKHKFLVQMVSHSSKEGAKTGSKVVSIVDCKLHTMEENRQEHITKKDITKEHRSYIAICENGYFNKVSRICGERSVVKRFHHTFESARNFLLEGANIVLLRYFALQRYKGTIKTECVMINGLICESIYVSQGVSQAVVNNTPLFVVKVERHIIEPNGYIYQTLTVLSLRGYMISHEWANNNYIMHLNPLLKVVPEKDLIEPHEPLRERWREDLQLLSDYLDFKSERSSVGARYVTENGTLTSTVRDYLQALLLIRPQDALHFTRHYFGSMLSAIDLPHDEFFDGCVKHVRYFNFEE